jgi:hypothetical protein
MCEAGTKKELGNIARGVQNWKSVYVNPKDMKR